MQTLPRLTRAAVYWIPRPGRGSKTRVTRAPTACSNRTATATTNTVLRCLRHLRGLRCQTPALSPSPLRGHQHRTATAPHGHASSTPTRPPSEELHGPRGWRGRGRGRYDAAVAYVVMSTCMQSGPPTALAPSPTRTNLISRSPGRYDLIRRYDLSRRLDLIRRGAALLAHGRRAHNFSSIALGSCSVLASWSVFFCVPIVLASHSHRHAKFALPQYSVPLSRTSATPTPFRICGALALLALPIVLGSPSRRFRLTLPREGTRQSRRRWRGAARGRPQLQRPRLARTFGVVVSPWAVMEAAAAGAQSTA
jgi:hypothetical protein